MLQLMLVAMGMVEPHSGIEFTPPAELRCVYLPEGPLDGCGDEEVVERLRAMKKEGAFLIARNPETGVVLVGRTIAARSASTMSEEALDQFVKGAAGGMSKLGTFSPAPNGEHLHWLSRSGELTVAMFQLSADLDTRAKHPSQAAVAGMLIPVGTEFISFTETSPEPDDVMPTLLRTLKAPPAYRVDPLFGASRAFQLGHLSGQLGGSLFCVALGLWGLWRFFRQLRPAKPAVIGRDEKP